LRTPASTPQVLKRPQAVILWSALAAAVVVFTVLSAVLPPQRYQPELARMLLPVIALLSVGDVVAGSFVLRSMRRNAATLSPELAAGFAGTQMIVACGMAVGIALFANVLTMVTGERLFLAFAGGAAAVLVWWFPTEARWARLSVAGAPTPRANRLVR